MTTNTTTDTTTDTTRNSTTNTTKNSTRSTAGPSAVTATGTFTFSQWDEKPVAGADGGARIAHAAVTNDFTGAIEATGTSCQYTLVYADETTGAFVGYEFVEGSVDGRTGSFVLEQRGSFGADGTIVCALTVQPGSGSGELAGLTGTGAFTARHGEPAVPYTLTYDFG